VNLSNDVAAVDGKIEYQKIISKCERGERK